MSTLSIPRSNATRTPQRGVRLLAVPGAALATVAVWLLTANLFGVALYQPAFGVRPPQALIAGIVAFLAFLAALAALVLSLGGPLSGHGVTSSNRLALLCMHLAVAAVVSPLLYRSSARRTSQVVGREVL